MNRLTRGVLAAALAAAIPLAGVAVKEAMSGDTASAQAPSPAGQDPATPAVSVEALIAGLTIVDALPKVPGYERDCTAGKAACVYGPAWTDDYTGPSAHNGCDTRSDVLAHQLVDVKFKPGTRDCKVVGGTLHDPYTGKAIVLDPAKPSAIQIDHVFALSRSWRAGAAGWTLAQRTSFANDTELNLLATDGPTNQAKSDKGLDEWMPSNTGYRCEYARKYLTVANTYRLAVTTGDVAAARAACSPR